ncbi:MAG: PorT family protein [Paramuribaculum sp.]|nr:PorT family protein [Paramuribaculum sp.]
MKKLSFAAVLMLTLVFILPARAQSFIDYGPARGFLELEVHALAGGSTITENYLGCFPEMTQMNSSPGTMLGAGVTAVFGIRDWIGLGTEFNLRFNRYRIDMAVSGGDATSISNIFLRNNATYFQIPVYMQFRFNVSENVRWRVDAGLYYAYGIGGKQQQDIYNAQVNSLGQLVSTKISTKPGYFDDNSTFIHSYRRSDIGLHLATSLLFNRFSVGAQFNIGFKNIAYIADGRGIITPNVHNLGYVVSIGYAL